MTKSQPVRAVIYARISNDKRLGEDGEGAGVERQQEACRLLARAREWELAEPALVDNDLSAFNGKHRPAYQTLLDLIRDRKVDAVLVWHMDRLCRRVADLVDITRICMETDVRISSVHGDYDLSSPVGRMFATILTAVAEYESAHKAERQVAAFERAARNGQRFTGSPRPFGYLADHVTPHPEEADAVRLACDQLLGGGSLGSVCRMLDGLGLRPPQGASRWVPNTIKAVLLNPRIAGKRTYKDDIFDGEPGDWQPLVPETTWRAVCALLTNPARRNPRGSRTLLGGLLCCPCGNVMSANQNGSGVKIYRCQPLTRPADFDGTHASVRLAALDAYVQAVIIERLSQPDIADLLAPPSRADTTELRHEAATIRAGLDKDAVDELRGLLDRNQLAARSEWGKRRLTEITRELADAGSTGALAVFAAGERAADVWAALDLSRKHAVIRALCSITLLPAGPGVNAFDADRVRFEWVA